MMNTLVVCQKCEKMNRVPLDRASSAIPVCGSCKSNLPLRDNVQDVSVSTLGKLIQLSDRMIVVDFWAEWCGPCKVFAPTFNAAARQLGGAIIFAKFNTEASPQAGMIYRIQSIPTLVVFKNRIEVDRQSGVMSLPMLREYLNKWK